MNDGKFQWDDDKAAVNRAKHGVTFEAAKRAFRDAFAIDWLDESEAYGEERFVTIGMVDGRLIVVAFAMRGEAIRIISARLAGRAERKLYHDENRD